MGGRKGTYGSWKNYVMYRDYQEIYIIDLEKDKMR